MGEGCEQDAEFVGEERGNEELLNEERGIEDSLDYEERGIEKELLNEDRGFEQVAFCDEERAEDLESEERRIEKELLDSEERRIEKLAFCDEERRIEEVPLSEERRIETTDERREDIPFDPEEREKEEINFQRGDSDEYTMDSYTDDYGEKKAALFGQWVSGVDAEDESEGGYLDNVVDGKLDDAMMLSFFSQSATTFGFDRAKTLSQKFRGTVVLL